MKKVRFWWTLTLRKARLKLAGWLTRRDGCITVGGDVLLQVVEKIASLESFIEKSGTVRHSTQAYAKLQTRVKEINQLIEIATRIGDPGTNAEQLVQHYMRARWMTMSRNQQRQYQQQAAAQAHAKLLPPKATVAA